MSNSFETLHAIFYGNMTDGMYAWLGEQLGVTPQALQDLQVGYVPVVTFKKDKVSHGWFSTPMRDSTGKITGLSLRNRDGHKVTYPGSTAGCFYAVNPKHRKGDHGYSSGKHNWVRTMDAGEVCPVCGKPDGCLLSAEDPTDPKAVLCLRTTSPVKLRGGWLHVRKAEGDLSGESLLAGSGPVLAVEGMSDVAAAASIGLSAVGRPSAKQGQDILAEVCRGRELIVVGENDKKSDGNWPGMDGALSVYTYCRKRLASVKLIMPPPTVKDMRAWVVTGGLTREAFDTYAEKDQAEKSLDMVLASNAPTIVAKAFLRNTYLNDKRNWLRRWEDSWYLYEPTLGRYNMIKDAAVRILMFQWAEERKCEVTNAKGVSLEPLVMTSAAWNNAQYAIEAVPNVIVEAPALPVWVNGARGASPKELVVFKNGILNVPAYTENRDDCLSEPTPDLFNTTALPVAFNQTATADVWCSFLQSSLGDDPLKIDLLQEWFGYCLTPDTTRQKMMYFRGESGSGKGTILRVLQSLVGAAQCASTSLSQLSESFGLQPLIGKLVCLIGDARMSQTMDAMRGLEVLLGLTGGDALQVNRKFKDQLEGSYLTARITVASNDFFDMPDHNGAMLRRLLVMQFPHKARHPDTTLSAKLDQEIEGIAVWALVGLKRLLDRGEFTIPDSSYAALAEWERDTNPIIAWIQDCTMEKPGVLCSKEELYDCWTKWAKDTHRSQLTRSIFLRKLVSNAPYAMDSGPGIKGIDLTPFAARRYLGRP